MSLPRIENPVEFLIDHGILFEMNRQVLHPLGLELHFRLDDEGRITAMHVALLVTLRIAGPDAVATARAALAAGPRPDAAQPGRWRRWWVRVSERRTTTGPGRPRNRELDAPDDIEFDVLRPR